MSNDVPAVTVDRLPDPLPPEVHVIDVREDHEWAAGHIEEAKHVPMGQLPDRVGELPQGRLLVVCRSGNRSGRVTAYLAQLGHDAVNLDGGMQDWADAGRPMVGDTPGAPVVR